MPRKTLEQRFWEKVDRRGDNECWPWQATSTHQGYGLFTIRGRTARAHRVAYEWLVEPIPEGFQIDHLCRNPSCVNPAHMEPVTTRENTLRGHGPTAENARKTHCKHGHEFTPENTIRLAYRPGSRRCRICKRRADAAAKRARGAKVKAAAADRAAGERS